MTTMGPRINAILEAKRAMQAAGFQPPAAIVLSSYDEGMALLHEVEQVPMFRIDRAQARPVEHPDGSVWMEVQIAEVKVHWPARPMATGRGRWEWT